MVSKRVNKIAEARRREMVRLADLSVQRLGDTVASLNARLMTAAQDAAQQELILRHTQDVAAVAQEILAVVSHDLRNPLNAIVLSAQVILNLYPNDPKLLQSVNRISSSTLSAMRLINDLLDYSQARVAGTLRIVRRKTNIHELAQASVDELEFARRGHSIHVRAAGDGVGQLDPDRIMQVFMNLISNALAHSPDDSDIEVATAGDGGSVAIRVHNLNRSGPIPPESRATLFEPFKPGSARSGSRTRSIGLGLYIVDQIVKAHGGRVEVSSNDEGTTFTVTLGNGSPAAAR